MTSKVELKGEEPDQADEVREYGRKGPNYWKSCQVQGLTARILIRLLTLEIYVIVVGQYVNTCTEEREKTHFG